jgi:hypothetical protein
MSHRSDSTSRAARYREQFAELRRQLQQSDYFCKGTVLARTVKCGRSVCACQNDPAKRHGPYWEWTYKLQGKTVNVKLTPAAAPIYQQASQQYRKLKTLLTRLERISHKALAAQAKQANTRPPL